MSVHIRPFSELTHLGTQALIRELGVVDALRFLSQFRTGSGNYTAEREQLFEGMSVHDIVAEIKTRRTANVPPDDPADAGSGRAST
jgi:hypothetical protein